MRIEGRKNKFLSCRRGPVAFPATHTRLLPRSPTTVTQTNRFSILEHPGASLEKPSKANVSNLHATLHSPPILKQVFSIGRQIGFSTLRFLALSSSHTRSPSTCRFIVRLRFSLLEYFLSFPKIRPPNSKRYRFIMARIIAT